MSQESIHYHGLYGRSFYTALLWYLQSSRRFRSHHHSVCIQTTVSSYLSITSDHWLILFLYLGNKNLDVSMKLMKLSFEISYFFISSSHPSQEKQSSIPLERHSAVRTWIPPSWQFCLCLYWPTDSITWKTCQAKLHLLWSSIARRQGKCGGQQVDARQLGSSGRLNRSFKPIFNQSIGSMIDSHC